jgi:hypothetical protein
MLLFVIMNMSNYRFYFMRQNASVLGGKVSVPVEYAVTQGRLSAPRSVACTHFDPSAPLIGRPRPLCTVRAMSFVVLAHCHPSSPNHLPSARTGTSPHPFAFHPRIQEEVRSRWLRSTHAWVQYKRQGATAREATISLYFTAWNSALSSLRETTYVDMALVGC